MILDELVAFTDGTCKQTGGSKKLGFKVLPIPPAGWGSAILFSGSQVPLAELYGPVITDDKDPR